MEQDIYKQTFNQLRKNLKEKQRNPFDKDEFNAYKDYFKQVCLEYEKDYIIEDVNVLFYENVLKYYAAQELTHEGKSISYEIKLDIELLKFSDDVIKNYIDNGMERKMGYLTFKSRWKLDKGILIMGQTGVGKDMFVSMLNRTHHKSVVKSMICRKVVCKNIEEDYKNKGSEVLNQFKEGQWNLCDIGQEKGNAKNYGNDVNVIQSLITTLYERWIYEKQMIIGTTNLNPSRLFLMYGEREFFRMVEMFNFGFMQGKNKRIK